MSKNTKQTSGKVARLAAKTLPNSKASRTAKSLAGSVVAQAHTDKQTGAELEDLASRVLQSPRVQRRHKNAGRLCFVPGQQETIIAHCILQRGGRVHSTPFLIVDQKCLQVPRRDTGQASGCFRQLPSSHHSGKQSSAGDLLLPDVEFVGQFGEAVGCCGKS